jgi:hypothetical protein
MDIIQKGSQTAKDGFINEKDIVEKFNNWKKDAEAVKWLKIMNYNIDEIEYVRAEILSGEKTDVQVQVTIKLTRLIDVENLQVKLVSNSKGYNQIDKRWVDKYTELWNIPEDIITIFKLFTGENKPILNTPRDKRRMFIDEFELKEQNRLIDWLKQNQSLIVSDILKGRGRFAAEWMLVVQKVNNNSKWTLKPMNYCLNFFGNGEIIISPKGSIKIGKITMQRKGGDGGRNTASMLQFKINPALLFD